MAVLIIGGIVSIVTNGMDNFQTGQVFILIAFKQARKPRSYGSPKLRLTDSLTGVKCRATSVAKNIFSLKILVAKIHLRNMFEKDLFNDTL